MSKGTQTRTMILKRAAPLFNQQGFFGASLSDVMQATGLEKGGIYNHFASKEQLALEAFDYAFSLHQQRITHLLASKRHAVDRLHAIVTYFQSIVEDPVIPGGCPILNTAIESDDAHPALRDRARNAMEQMHSTIERIITRGIERKELRASTDPITCATLFLSTLEGAVMLSKLYQDSIYIHRVVAFLSEYIEIHLRIDAQDQTQPAMQEM